MSGPLLFGFQITAVGADQNAYYSASFVKGQIAEGGAVTVYPSQPTQSAFYVAIQNTFQGQFPPGGIAASLVVSATDDTISGQFVVSPALSVPVTATLYGSGGPIGNPATIPAGDTNGVFQWSVTPNEGLGDVAAFVKQKPQS